MNPKLIFISGPHEGTVFLLTDDDISIGREPSNAICIADRLLSRRHCRVFKDGEAFKLCDLNSRNGTFINRVPVREQTLGHRDEIKVGDSLLLFVGHEEEIVGAGSVEFSDDDPNAQSTVFLRREDSLYLNPAKAQAGGALTARTASYFQALLQLGREVISLRKLDELQERLMELIFTVVPAERGAILLTDPGAEEFSSIFIRKLSEKRKQEGQQMKISRSILQQARSGDGGILSARAANDASPQEPLSLYDSGAHSALAVRLAVSNEVFGVIYLDTADPAAGFDEEHLQLLTAIANLAAGALETARYVERLKDETKRLQSELDFDRVMIGESAAMKDVRAFIAKVAPTDSTVLIRGESGTGKELVARAIHRNSLRAGKPFVAVNCAVLPENLIESELFGHEKGAFTGAIAQKKGLFELANGGTIFLDEIGEMPVHLQTKLLRVLQEGEFSRLGSERLIKLDVRVIAATNKNLEAAIQAREFRADLFFRLNVLAMTTPTLRERSEDIVQIASYFVVKYAAKYKRRIKCLSADASAYLQRYDWRGNVRELESAIQRAVVMAETEFILPEDLPEDIVESDQVDVAAAAPDGEEVITEPMIVGPVMKYHAAMKEAKKQILVQAIEQAGGNFAEAAKLLGLHPNNLYRFVRNLSLRPRLKKLP